MTNRNKILKPIVWLVCLAPLLNLAYNGVRGELGANPIERITFETGWWTLVLLVASLAITPLRRITKLYWLIDFRRLIGLFAFFTGTLHMLTYVWLDQFFDVHSIVKDVVKRPFITMGTLSFLCMVPLALTSTQASIRRLGKKWRTLHRLAYVSAIAGVVHFYWLVKKDVSEPLYYAGWLVVLFGLRFWFIYADKKKSTKLAVTRTDQVTA